MGTSESESPSAQHAAVRSRKGGGGGLLGLGGLGGGGLYSCKTYEAVCVCVSEHNSDNKGGDAAPGQEERGTPPRPIWGTKAHMPRHSPSV